MGIHFRTTATYTSCFVRRTRHTHPLLRLLRLPRLLRLRVIRMSFVCSFPRLMQALRQHKYVCPLALEEAARFVAWRAHPIHSAPFWCGVLRRGLYDTCRFQLVAAVLDGMDTVLPEIAKREDVNQVAIELPSWSHVRGPCLRSLHFSTLSAVAGKLCRFCQLGPGIFTHCSLWLPKGGAYRSHEDATAVYAEHFETTVSAVTIRGHNIDASCASKDSDNTPAMTTTALRAPSAGTAPSAPDGADSDGDTVICVDSAETNPTLSNSFSLNTQDVRVVSIMFFRGKCTGLGVGMERWFTVCLPHHEADVLLVCIG